MLVDPLSARRFLIDATPDIADQIARAAPHPSSRQLPGARPALVDGILLTHAHIGHYAGLLQLGKEVYGARSVPTWTTQPMAEFLSKNEPWATLVREGTLELRRLTPGERISLSPNLDITPLAVPHRDELSDTVAFLAHTPDAELLYLPDIDRWEPWETPIEGWLEQVDVALLDGTFFDGGELPGRDLSKIPHPLIATSIERFAQLSPAVRAKVRFTHLNHSNPAANPDSVAAAAVRAAGHAIAREGERIDL